MLSEKPIAKDVETSEELIAWYKEKIDSSKVTWGVAENFRFLDSYLYAAEQIKQMGRVLGFRLRMNAYVEPGSKYYGKS